MFKKIIFIIFCIILYRIQSESIKKQSNKNIKLINKNQTKISDRFLYIINSTAVSSLNNNNNNNKNKNITYKKNYYEINSINDTDESDGFLARKKNFLDIYYDGVQSYLFNDWKTCISLLERSIALFNEYYDATAYCRITCEIDINNINYIANNRQIKERIFEEIIHKTLCLEKCRREYLGELSRWFNIDNKQHMIFKERKPYQYLQLCYFKDNQIEKAIHATYTAIIANPGDTVMEKNIKYYSTLTEFDYETLKDLEDKEYSKYYQDGLVAYENKNWEKTIKLFETFLKKWILENDKCRAFCEGEFYQGWMPDFTTSIANHYVYTLRCKQNCTNDLSFTNGRYYEDFLPSAFDYLQFSYFHNKQIKQAVKCVVSYLLFYPKSEEMLESLDYYKSLDELVDEDFTPRQDANKLYKLLRYERDLLDKVDEDFTKLSDTDDKTFR